MNPDLMLTKVFFSLFFFYLFLVFKYKIHSIFGQLLEDDSVLCVKHEKYPTAIKKKINLHLLLL